MRKGRGLEAPALLCPRILLAREQNDTDFKDIDFDEDCDCDDDDDDDDVHFRKDGKRFHDDVEIEFG
jgi:hypothetical protein